MKNNKYRCSIYLRLSKEDGDKSESDSISNQRELIYQFLRDKPEIQVVSERIDDGYSGVNFDRPAMKKLIEDAKNGVINCLVVKDLSRLGRNYIDVGKYLDDIFPSNGIRVISINEGYDSVGGRTVNDNLVVPLLNFMNDSYLRDISHKVRSHLEVKRKKGDLMAPFAVYGYLKHPNDKHKLIVDDYAANIVREIFDWKIQGMSQQKIADKLNSLDVLSPLEYKRYCGLDYKSSFQKKAKAQWSAVAIGRILKNECYIGTMVQGKRSLPNHKSKKAVYKSSEEWIRVENTHEAIVNKSHFMIVNQLLLADTRIAPCKNEVYLFSGLLYCGDCGNGLVRNGVYKNGKKYFYYMCGRNRTYKECSSHRISETSITNSVLVALQQHISNIVKLDRLLSSIEKIPINPNEFNKFNVNIVGKEQEIKRYEHLKTVLFEKFSDAVIEKEEYLRLKEFYDNKQALCQKSINELNLELNKLIQNRDNETVWMQKFKQYRNIDSLDRKITVNLIDKITVYNDKRIEIRFKYQYNYELAAISATATSNKEAV